MSHKGKSQNDAKTKYYEIIRGYVEKFKDINEEDFEDYAEEPEAEVIHVFLYKRIPAIISIFTKNL